ncbi:hypothetical protein EG329_001602 [Mollisiaceae sp. DMI_Dod_QoI]|nr:hypothetical protein EG329_001602 [Helotiales sp. DMI_Dod_QoI]
MVTNGKILKTRKNRGLPATTPPGQLVVVDGYILSGDLDNPLSYSKVDYLTTSTDEGPPTIEDARDDTAYRALAKHQSTEKKVVDVKKKPTKTTRSTATGKISPPIPPTTLTPSTAH